MKTLGFLGGMTYHSTALYYSQINKHINDALGGSSSALLILHSLNHAEIGAHFARGEWNLVADRFTVAANNMKAGGAQAMAIGCNIGHKVAEEVEARSGLQLLHIADFAAAEIKKRGLSKVALLATGTAMEDDFIKGRLVNKAGVEVVIPEEEDRAAVNTAIFTELSAGIFSAETRAKFAGIVRKLVEEKGAQGVVLACTELLFVVKQEDVSVPIFETMELHARGLADWMLSEEVA